MLKVKMFDKEIDCQLDTGAAISILSERQWIDLGQPKLNETDVQPTKFDGTIIKTLGQSYIKFVIDNKESYGTFVVVTSNKSFGLIGRNIIN